MAFWLIAVGVAAAASVGMSVAGGIKQEQYAKEGMEHSKKITLLNAVGDVISSIAESPKSIPQFH